MLAKRKHTWPGNKVRGIYIVSCNFKLYKNIFFCLLVLLIYSIMLY